MDELKYGIILDGRLPSNKEGLVYLLLFFISQKPSGRLMLLECLKWDSFDEDKDMQRSIHLDFLYDYLMFAVNKGFSWDKVVTVFDFGSELLSEIKGITQV